jgi:hypothetical protein
VGLALDPLRQELSDPEESALCRALLPDLYFILSALLTLPVRFPPDSSLGPK